MRSTLEILNIGEVAKLLHLRKKFIYQRTRKQTIPHFKVGKLLRFSRTEVLEWFGTMHRGGNPARERFKRIEEKEPIHIQ